MHSGAKVPDLRWYGYGRVPRYEMIRLLFEGKKTGICFTPAEDQQRNMPVFYWRDFRGLSDPVWFCFSGRMPSDHPGRQAVHSLEMRLVLNDWTNGISSLINMIKAV